MSDDEFIRHLEEKHPGDIRMRWPKSGPQRRMTSRKTHELYHDMFLHREPRRADHSHEAYYWTDWEGNERMDRGWTQKTPCVCLHPPTHAPDCTGKLGVNMVDETTGPSAYQKIWAALDLLTDELKSGTAAGVTLTAGELTEHKARASAYCYALALMMSPSSPDMDAIRKEAMRRWKERNGE